MEKELLNTFDKELLLRDLCARLPYGVKYNFGGHDGCDYTMSKVGLSAVDDNFPIEDIKPYLFPLSSMTDKQKDEYQYITERWMNDPAYSISDSIDWLNKNHFDHRGLIEKGLAIDATGLNIYSFV